MNNTFKESFFTKLNPFKNKYKPDTNYDKFKEIKILKNSLIKSLKDYQYNIKKDPKNKNNYIEQLSEELLSALQLEIAKLQEILGDLNLKEEVNQEYPNKLKYLIQQLDLIDRDTSLTQIEKLLIHMYETVKKNLQIDSELDYNNIDIDDEVIIKKNFLKAFLKHPTSNLEVLKNIVKKDEDGEFDDHSDYLNKIKNNSKSQFDKEWESKYKNEWFENFKDENMRNGYYDVSELFSNYDEYEKAWLEKHPTQEELKNGYNDYFEKWFNTFLISKFNKLWDSEFKNKVLNKNVFNADRERLSHLKEKFQNIFTI